MKTCKIENCNNPIWSNSLCKNHSSKTQLQSGKKSFNVQNNIQLSEMKQFFMNYWRAHKPHVCENCNVHLGKEPLTYMFDHVLEKSKYPHLAFEEENIMYLCLQCHDNKSRGNLSFVMEERMEYLKNKFNI